MNKMKILLAVLMAALLLTACRKEPVEDPTTDTSEQLQVTEESATEENIPGVADNQFDEDDIQFATDPVNVDDGDGTVTNTGNGNEGSTGNQGSSGNQGSTGNQGSSGNQGGSGSQGSTGNQGSSGNQGSTGNQGSSGNEGSTGNQGSSGNEGSTGNQGGSGNEGSSGNQGGSDAEDPTESGSDSFYVTYEEYNAMSPEEQVEYFNKFSSMEAFVQWYNEAKDAYDAEHGAIEIGGDGSVDLGDIVDP